MQRGLSQLVGLLPLFLGCAGGAAKGSIGAVLSQSRADGRVVLRQVPPRLSAAQAGLEAGDEVLLIDGRDVRRMTPEGVHQSLEGEVGSTVRLTVFRRGKIDRVALRRAPLGAPEPP
jgi:carboxyl-terminal processing protease